MSRPQNASAPATQPAGAVEDRWRKRIKDADGNTIDMPSAVAGKVTRWRARYIDDRRS